MDSTSQQPEQKRYFSSDELRDLTVESEKTYVEDIQSAVSEMVYGQLQVTLRVTNGFVEDIVITNFSKKRYKRLSRPDLNQTT